ncbi:MAG: DMT family transporter [Pseudorhodobacter sp.]
MALRGLPVLSIVWLRVGLAALMLAVVVLARGLAFPARAHWPALLVMGLLNNALPFSLIALAQGQISGALASILNATTPLFTLLVAHLATVDERITPKKAAGLGLGFSGVVVMLAGEPLDGATLAKLAALMAASSYAVASVWGRRFRATGLGAVPTAFGQVAASTVILFPAMLVVDRPWAMGAPATSALLAVVALALLSTAMAYLIYFRLLATAGATRLSLVTFLIPVSATALGVVFLGEVLQPRHLGGFALIALGLVAISGRTVATIAQGVPR